MNIQKNIDAVELQRKKQEILIDGQRERLMMKSEVKAVEKKR